MTPLMGLSVLGQVNRALAAWKGLGLTISDELWEEILEQADAFEPVSDSDEPHVTGVFHSDNPTAVANELFGAFRPPEGAVKLTYMSDAELRYAPGMEPTAKLRLVHYDPNAYPGLSSEAAIEAARHDNVQLAGIEVLEHLMLNPAITLAWDGRLHYFPKLSVLQRKYEESWSMVPCLGDWEGTRKIEFSSVWAYDNESFCSSPTIREC